MREVDEGRREFHCHACDGRLEIERKPGRRDDCPDCGAALHACLNCALFEPSAHRGCREPQADDVREKARANFCGWFEFKAGRKSPNTQEAAKAAAAAFFGATGSEDKPAADAMARFFSRKPRDADAERTRAHDAFDALMRKPKED